MTTHPHRDPENGYALRIGKNLPKNATNLAYVHTDTPAPSKNVIVQDFSSTIPENSLRVNERRDIETTVNEEGYLEDAEGLLTLSRPEVLVTDEYALTSKKTPLYYVYRTRGLFDARRAPLSHELGGNETTRTFLFEEYQEGELERFVYEGDKIQIMRGGGRSLDAKDRFKIVLERSGNQDFTYRIVLYTNFLNHTDNYEIHYPRFEEEQNKRVVETINPENTFERRMAETNDESEKEYTIVEQDGQYAVKFPFSNEDNFLVDESVRPPHYFEYNILSHIKTRFGDNNPIKVNIGIIYVNDSVMNVTRTAGALKKIAYNNPYMPDFVTFENPHNRSGYHEPANSTYWETELNMPKEHWLDYDVLILSGYGNRELTSVSDSMNDFLASGGTLLVDNAGEGESVLDFTNEEGQQTFIRDVSFSKDLNEESVREFTPEAVMKDRYYDIQDPHEIGRTSPSIVFNGNETMNDWKVLLRHRNGGPALMEDKAVDVGRLVLSNMNWMLDILYENKESIQFFSNFLLYILEERSFAGPIFSDFVYHKNDLYANEYQDKEGNVLYLDDRSDEDDSQIVAKKVIEERIQDKVTPYLPTAYRNWQNIEYDVRVSDSGNIPLTNARMELSGAESLFEETTLEALPGFDFIKFSGDSVLGEQVRGVAREGTRSLRVKTIDAQGFFEQEIGYLQPGLYELEGYLRSENAEGGGVAFYRTDGTLITALEETAGTSNWRQFKLRLQLSEATNVTLRLGAHSERISTDLYFDDFTLATTGVVRMTPNTSREEPLYAYAISPKQKNSQLRLYEQTRNRNNFILKDASKDFTLTVRSFVYKWYSGEVRYRKEYGNQKDTRFSMSTNTKEEVLGNVQEFLPDLRAGIEWARKDRVYYEFDLRPAEGTEFVNISVYDPSTNNYFFNTQGHWVLNHEDIWWNGYDSTVEVRASFSNYHLLGTEREYSVRKKDENKFKVLPPGTEDERDRWYLQIQNGSFKKNTLNTRDMEETNRSGREGFYNEHIQGIHDYQLPEYERQSFYPNYGERLVHDELALYLDENKIQVQRTPLLIKEGVIEKERLTPLNEKQTVFQSNHILWNKNHLPTIYYDEWQNGDEVLLTQGFRIDYEEGKVLFDKEMPGTVWADYAYDNFEITRRRYANSRIKGELLRSRDNYSYQTNQKNLAIEPAPVLYEGTISEETRIPVDTYTIDYETGTFTFFEKRRTRIYADYLYYIEEELEWKDANQYSGEITLNKRISFKDEVFVSYVIKENNFEYKGYYDEEVNDFVHLDLNPSAGHTFSLLQEVNGQKQVVETAGERLLNKEIYLYILPYRSLYYKTTEIEERTVRHVFGEEGFLNVKAAHPEALLLGVIQVRENTDVDSITLLDARRPGGGLKEHIKERDIEQRVGYTSTFWDIGSFDGLAYYRNGVNVIRIPSYILQSQGGLFTEDQIKEYIEKYVAYGTYQIIEYTDTEQEIPEIEWEEIRDEDFIEPEEPEEPAESEEPEEPEELEDPEEPEEPVNLVEKENENTE